MSTTAIVRCSGMPGSKLLRHHEVLFIGLSFHRMGRFRFSGGGTGFLPAWRRVTGMVELGVLPAPPPDEAIATEHDDDDDEWFDEDPLGRRTP